MASWQPSPMRAGERFNTATHLFGLALAVAGAAMLLTRTVAAGDAARVLGASVFALATIALYSASFLFHSSQGALRALGERLDHCAIHLLIAGSYTPFALASALDGWTWALLAGVWAAAGWAIVCALRAAEGEAPPLHHFLGMGWLAVLAVAPLAAGLQRAALAWLLVGAAVYSAGTVFYRNRRRWRHAHGTWHLFVVGGTASHYMAVSRSLI